MPQYTRRHRRKKSSFRAGAGAVAVFKGNGITGEVVVKDYKNGVRVDTYFSELPKGKHGFHIHKAGDLRGEGCLGACEHFHIGSPQDHGGPPSVNHREGYTGHKGQRHTGDLGNIEIQKGKSYYKKTYYINGVNVKDLWGRSIIIHADEDDLGKGSHEDSKTTGHSGKRIGCAIFGRALCKNKNKTMKK